MDNSKFRTLYGEKKSPTTPKLLPITKKNYSKPIIHYTVRRYDLPTDYEDIKNKITIKNPLKYFGKEALRPIYGKLFSNPNVPLIKSSSITPTISTNEELMTNISTTDDGLSLKEKKYGEVGVVKDNSLTMNMPGTSEDDSYDDDSD